MAEPSRQLREIEQQYQFACGWERKFRRNDWFFGFALALTACISACVPALDAGFDVLDAVNYGSALVAAVLWHHAMRSAMKRRRAFRELADSVHEARRALSPSAPASKD